ncbi:PDR/VanB family oxidoreductase [Novosphingobium sp. BL-8H]|uniref:PDR/VanB family oxidoreductase n=1 Tax=Novosphingobium sp. BL-8H TaxID=3127640 RepID=UPI00375821CE
MSTTARLSRKTILSHDIAEFRFESLDAPFQGIEPGAHIDVHLGDGLIRQYSLCDWDPAGKWVAVAIKREDGGRGGSRAAHALQEGAVLKIGGPRNHFALKGHATPVLLLGGGIGATPILAMGRHLASTGADVRVVYLTRSRADAALHDAFTALALGDAYRLHCDEVAGFCDIDELLASHPAEGDIYVCGPEPMLQAVLEAGKRQQRPHIHFERFAAAPDRSDAPLGAFEVEVNSTGQVFTIAPEQSILGVLQEANFSIEFGCSEGICGACMVNVLEGEIDHRDSVLADDERDQNDYMCICVSRAKSGKLKLDL